MIYDQQFFQDSSVSAQIISKDLGRTEDQSWPGWSMSVGIKPTGKISSLWQDCSENYRRSALKKPHHPNLDFTNISISFPVLDATIVVYASVRKEPRTEATVGSTGLKYQGTNSRVVQNTGGPVAIYQADTTIGSLVENRQDPVLF